MEQVATFYEELRNVGNTKLGSAEEYVAAYAGDWSVGIDNLILTYACPEKLHRRGELTSDYFRHTILIYALHL